MRDAVWAGDWHVPGPHGGTPIDPPAEAPPDDPTGSAPATFFAPGGAGQPATDAAPGGAFGAPGTAPRGALPGGDDDDGGPGQVLKLGPGTTSVNVTMVADTNRDGSVSDADLSGRDNWTATSGAIYAVNFDDDNSDGNNDAVRFNDSGTPINENFTVENAADAQDLAPLVIKALGSSFDPGTMQVTLSVASLQDAQSIHVFGSITAGATSILGGVGNRVAGGTAAAQSVDITSLVSATADTTLGVEGLFFRNTGSINTFDGTIDFTVTVKQGSTTLGSDNVRMKVAPWMMLPHSQPSEVAYAGNFGTQNDETLFNSAAEPGYFGLDNSGQLTAVSSGQGNQWFQDHIEIGYTQRPGGPATQMVFRLPYFRGTGVAQPPWSQNLLAPDVGTFQLGVNLGAGAGDYGGNLEVLPPTASYPLGRILLGTSGSTGLLTFLQSQEVQPVFQIPTRWLAVSHVDEIIGFTQQANKVIVADPQLAYDLMNAIPVADRGKAVFFATGADPLAATVTSAGTSTRIFTGIDHTGQNFQYLRVYEGTGAGQVARVAPGGLGNGFIDINQVWNTTSNVINPGASPTPTSAEGAGAMAWALTADAPRQSSFFVTPGVGAKLVLVGGTRFWNNNTNGTPAIITVQEVLADAAFQDLNLIDVQGTINDSRSAMEAAAGGAGTLVFEKVPVLYFGRRQGFATNRRAVAMTPGLQNFVPLGADQYFPRQFGPRSAVGTFGGQITFTTNDADENPFNFSVTGTVLASGSGTPGGVIGGSGAGAVKYLDDGDTGFSYTSGWFPNYPGDSGKVPYQGDLTWANAGTGSELATWAFTGLEPGQYKLAGTWKGFTWGSSATPVDVYNGTAAPANKLTATPILLDQKVDSAGFTDAGAAWKDLGTFTITGSTLTVQMSNNVAADTYPNADAFRLEKVGGGGGGGTTVTKNDTPFDAVEGTWNSGYTEAGRTDYQGSVSWANPSAGAATAYAWYKFTVTPGTYTVQAGFNGYSWAATNTPFFIYDGDNTNLTPSGIPVNQTVTPTDATEGGVGWKTLGSFTITTTTIWVGLSNAADNYVFVDAVRIIGGGGGGGPNGPEVQVLLGTAEVFDNNGAVSFGSTPAGTAVQQTYTVKNVGNQTLNLGALKVPVGYTLVSGFGSTTLAPNAQTTFTVRLNATPTDVFEAYTSSKYPNAYFVDVWDLYHRLLGELHCGVIVKHTPYSFGWWANQP